MTREAMIDLMENHDDIMFECRGFKYTLLTYARDDEGYMIGEQYKRGETPKPMFHYASPDELIDNFMIGQNSLASVIEEATLEMCS